MSTRATALIAAGLLAVAIVIQWPAREAATLVGLPAAGVDALSWRGTLWRGGAEGLRWRDLSLGTLAWRTDPLRLLVLAAQVRVTVTGPELEAAATVVAGLLGRRLAVRDVRVEGPAGWLPRILGPTPGSRLADLGGRLRAELAAVRFDGGWLTALDGTVRWIDARVLDGTAAPLGGFELRWETANGVIRGVVSDMGGPVTASGTVTLAERRFEVDVTVNAPPDQVAVRRALALVGRPDGTGAVRLAFRGPMAKIR